MPTGSMTNQVAIRSHTESGDLVLMDAASHVVRSEGGGPAALSGVTAQRIAGRPGHLHGGPGRGCAGHAPRGVPHNPCAARHAAMRREHPQRRRRQHLAAGDTGCGGRRRTTGRAAMPPRRRPRLERVGGHGRGRRPATRATATACRCASPRRWGRRWGRRCAGRPPSCGGRAASSSSSGAGSGRPGVIAAGALYALEHHRDGLVHAITPRRASSPMCWCPSQGWSWCGNTSRRTSCASGCRATRGTSWTRAWRRAWPCWWRGGSDVRAVMHRDVSVDDVERAAEVVRGVLEDARRGNVIALGCSRGRPRRDA